MKTGIELISAERQRQISEEGWTPSHDSQHTKGELAAAGATYGFHAASLICEPSKLLRSLERTPGTWPWEDEWWKPEQSGMGYDVKDQIRNLVKGAALFAAEIDRLQRNYRLEP